MNPIYEEKVQTLEFTDIGMEILRNARNELYLNMRFLDVALSSLQFMPDGEIRGLGTDGVCLYFQPDALVTLFRKGREALNRTYLHSIIHCLFCHLWNRKDRDAEYWNLACDIAAEYVIDGLYLRAVHVPKSMLRREYYRKLKELGGVVTAERIYRNLCREHPVQAQLDILKREFRVDDHRDWEQDQDKNSKQPQQQKWDDIRDRMQTEIETFSKEAADDVRSLEEQVAAENRERYDYREFLRRFSVWKEEMQVDMDSFDYIFYYYGMERYGNMPLIEPLETKEQQKIEDFVIVVDTSMSCKGELIRTFLEQTYQVLSGSESFFRKIHIHILQCDDKVQEDVVITNHKELEDYMRHFVIRGFGGTDFRPAFAYVQELLRRKSFTKLRGLIYFTDGYGTFPVKKPPYETAFVFMKEDYRDVDVPPWAIKLIIDEEELMREKNMNIKRAKQEIKDTIEAYLLKDEYGEYVIPQIRQRPVLLLGAPGIGKTQIMEQIAKECGVGLVAYTITHHTRQSAIGLPYISKHVYGEKEYSVTEYTMSEIVASIYTKIEKTGLREGILFIDEINCVSETLAPAMLQFLQCKMFGNHEIPQGWMIVAAGNPPEYNKSVREFDVVTMDRVKKIEVEPDFAVWKEYAVKEQLHPAVIAYLNTRTANFYRMETTVDGRKFATPRGWEDLSQMLTVYEKLSKTMDRDVIVQYIQHEKIAKDFANYLELYYKYQMDYQLDAVLAGTIDDLLLKKASHASFDEKLSVVSLLLSRCRKKFSALLRREKELELLFEQLKVLRDGLTGAHSGQPFVFLREVIEAFQNEYESRKAAELLTRREDGVYRSVLQTLEEYQHRLVLQGITAKETERCYDSVNEKAEAAEKESVNTWDNQNTVTDVTEMMKIAPSEEGSMVFDQIRTWFNEAQDMQEQDEDAAAEMLEHAFDFMEAAFGAGQEMVIFITELNSDYYSVKFLQQYECERYYRYNKQLLFEESGRAIEEKLRQMGK